MYHIVEFSGRQTYNKQPRIRVSARERADDLSVEVLQLRKVSDGRKAWEVWSTSWGTGMERIPPRPLSRPKNLSDARALAKRIVRRAQTAERLRELAECAGKENPTLPGWWHNSTS